MDFNIETDLSQTIVNIVGELLVDRQSIFRTENFKLPSITSNDFKKISSIANDCGSTYTTILKNLKDKLKNEFIFELDAIELIAKKESDNTCATRDQTRYVLFSFLIFVDGFVRNQNDLSTIVLFFEALKKVHSSDFAKELVENCFFSLLVLSFNSTDFLDIYDLSVEYTEYFLKNMSGKLNDLHVGSLCSFFSFSLKVINTYENRYNNMYAILGIIEHTVDKFQEHVLEFFIKSLIEYAEKLNCRVLSFLCCVSEHTYVKDSVFLRSLPQIFWQNISSKDMYIPVEEYSIVTVSEGDFYVEGVLEIPNCKVEVVDLFSPELNEPIAIIINMCRKSGDLMLKVFWYFSDFIRKNSSDLSTINIVFLVVYLSDILSKCGAVDEQIIHDLLASCLFNPKLRQDPMVHYARYLCLCLILKVSNKDAINLPLFDNLCFEYLNEMLLFIINNDKLTDVIKNSWVFGENLVKLSYQVFASSSNFTKLLTGYLVMKAGSKIHFAHKTYSDLYFSLCMYDSFFESFREFLKDILHSRLPPVFCSSFLNNFQNLLSKDMNKSLKILEIAALVPKIHYNLVYDVTVLFCRKLLDMDHVDSEMAVVLLRTVLSVSIVSETDPPEVLYLCFIKLLENDVDFDNIKKLIDEEGLLCHVLLRIMAKVYWERSVDLFYQMIKDNKDVLHHLHVAEIDLMIIEKIGETCNFDHKLLAIFQNIAKVVSSPIVVNKFLTLYVKVQDDRVLNETILSLLDCNMKTPEGYMDFLRTKLEVDISTYKVVRSKISVKGLSLTSWICVTDKENGSLFSLHSNEGVSELLISNYNLIFLSNKKELTTFSVERNAWYFITLTVSDEIELYVNGAILFSANNERKEYKKLSTIYIGGSEFDMGKIGPNGIFCPLTSDEIIYIFEANPIINITNDQKAYARYASSNVRNTIMEKVLYYRGVQEMMELPKTVLNNKMSFAKSLLDVCKLDVLLPVFKFSDFYSAFAMLDKALRTSVDVQKHFYQINGVEILAYFMRDIEPDLALFEKIIKIHEYTECQELRQSLMEKILFSFELWFKRLYDFEKVTIRWRDFVTVGSVVDYFGSFSNYFNNILNVIWLRYNKDDVNNENNDIFNSIKKNIYSIIINFYADTFTVDDAKMLIWHSLILHEKKIILDILSICFELLFSKACSCFFDDYVIFCLLYLFSNIKDEEIIVKALKLVVHIMLKRNENLETTLQTHELLCFLLGQRTSLTDLLLTQLIKVTIEDCRLVLYIASYVAFRMGPQYVIYLIKNVGQGFVIRGMNNWCQWLIASAIKYNDIREEIYTYLCEFGKDQIIRYMPFITYFSTVIDKDYRDEMRKFIVIAIRFVNKSNLDQFLLTFSNYIFYGFHNFSIINKTAESYNYRSVDDLYNSWGFLHKYGFCQAIDEDKFEYERKITNNTFSYKEHQFSLDLKNNSVFDFDNMEFKKDVEWMDLEVCKMVLMRIKEIGEHKNKRKYCIFVLRFISFFDADFSKNYYENHVEIMSLPLEPSLYSREYHENCVHLSVTYQETVKQAQKYYLELISQHEDTDPNQSYNSNNVLNENNKTYHKCWNALWSQLTLENAPWYDEKEVEKHYKRYSILASNFIPMLTRRNNHFDIHLESSMLRDNGEIFEIKIPKINDVKASKEIQFDPGSRRIEKPCTCITVKYTKEANFIVHSLDYNTMIYINGENISKQFKTTEIRFIFIRRVTHINNAIEIFLHDGRSYFVSFSDPNSRSQIVSGMIRYDSRLQGRCQTMESFMDFFHQMDLTKKWANGEITTLRYLMMLNMYSSRSFNNSSLYPLVPWVLSDYSSEKLDITNPNSFRDLTKPIGALNDERLDDLKKRNEDLQKVEKNSPLYLYSSYAISPVNLYLYLIRLEPFTTQHIDIQSGRFDTPQRLFVSIPQAYKSILNVSGDYRELIPEFYCMPEFLINLDNFDLGKIQGVPVSDVILPKWAKSPADFIYKNRKALESEYCDSMIDEWINLIWGYKQRGEKAYECDNMYRPEMYDDCKNIHIFKPNELRELLTMISCVPPQLFRNKHPKRIIKTDYFFEEQFNIEFEIKPACTILPIYNGGSDICINIIVGNILVRKKFEKGNNDPKSLDTVDLNSFPSDLRFANHISNGICIGSCNESSQLILFDINKYTSIATEQKRSTISNITSSEKFVAITSSDSRTHVYCYTNKLEFVTDLPSYSSTITCSAISTTFKVVINAVSDNKLVMANMYNGLVIRTFHLEFRPLYVTVTPEWGFVLSIGSKIVSSGKCYFMDVRTINDTHILTKEIDFQPSVFKTFSSLRGFDFIVLGTNEGKVYIAEVYYLNPKLILECGDPIVSLDIFPAINLIIVGTKLTAHFIPLRKEFYDDLYIE